MRVYEADEIARHLATLDSNNGNLKMTARHTGVPRKTLADWKKRQTEYRVANGDPPPPATPPPPPKPREETVAELLPAAKKTLAGEWERVAFLALSQITDERLKEDAPAGVKLATVAGIATEKHRLCLDLATSITDDRSTDGVSARAATLASVLDAIRARRLEGSGQRPPGVVDSRPCPVDDGFGDEARSLASGAPALFAQAEATTVQPPGW